MRKASIRPVAHTSVNKAFILTILAWVTLIIVPLSWGQTPAVTFTGSLVTLPWPGISCSWGNPCSMTADAAGNLYFVSNTGVVEKVDNAGTQTTITYLGGRPSGQLAVDKNGNLYVSDWDAETVVQISPNGAKTTVFSGWTGYGVAVDNSGTVYWSMTPASGPPYTVISAQAGTTNCQVVSWTKGQCWTPVGNLQQGWSLAVDSFGNVFSASDSGVYELAYGTTQQTHVPGDNTNTVREGLTIDSAGNLYVASMLDVYEISSGVQTTPLSLPNNGHGISGLAVDGQGNLYILDSGENQLLKLTLRGGQFGTTPLGQTATGVLTFTINVDGTTLHKIATVGPDFQVVQSGGSCATDTPYTSGSTCTVEVSFTPIAPGQRMGALNLKDSGGNLLAQVPLVGYGAGPVVTFTPGTINTIAGNGTSCSDVTKPCGDGGPALAAQIGPMDLAVDNSGNIFIASENRIRKIDGTTGYISTVAGSGSYCGSPGNPTPTAPCGDGGLATAAQMYMPISIAVDGAGNLYVTDFDDNRIRRVDANTGIITTVAGNGSPNCPTNRTMCFGGDGGPATAAQLFLPRNVAIDGAGNLYITDTSNARIRKVDAASGNISTVAGTGTATMLYNGDGIAATAANLWGWAVALDSATNLFIADAENSRIREVNAATGIISTVAGNGTGMSSGSIGLLATSTGIESPMDVALDKAGNMYFTSASGYPAVFEVPTATGLLMQVAGTGVTGYTGDGGPPTSAQVGGDLWVAFDASGNMYISDADNSVIRKVDVSTPPTLTFAATPVGQTSTTQSVTIQNSGNQPLTFSNITTSNAALDGSTTCTTATPVPAGGTCVLGVQFAPQTAGAGTVVLYDNAPNSPQTINLSGGTSGPTIMGMTVSGSPNPSTYGTSVTLTASISVSSGSPTGTVTFIEAISQGQQNQIGAPATVVNGQASVSTSSLGIGSHIILANYSGDSTFSPYQSSVLKQIVNYGVALGANVSSANYGDSVTFTATVTPGNPGGFMYFFDGGVQFGTAPVNSGQATYATSALGPGSHSITAQYYNPGSYYGGISAPVTLTVTGWTPPTSSSASATVGYLDPVVVQAGGAGFSLQVYGSGFTSGAVVQWNGSARTTVFDDSAKLTATITAADIAISGTIPVTVKNSDGTVSPSFFIAVDTTPSPTSPVTLTANNVQLQVPQGQLVTNTMTLTGGSGSGTVQVTCLNLPPGASCTYDSNSKKLTITTSGSTPKGLYQIVVVFTQTQPNAALRHSRILLATFGGLGLPFGFLWLGRRGKKRPIWLVVGLAALALVVLLAACGGSSGSSTTAVATGAQNPAVTQVSVPVTLQVK